MTRKVILAVSGFVLAVVAAYVATRREPDETGYRLVAITRGDIESAVSATGTLSAVSAVQVGTQVSGQVSEIFADFNDGVKKGQVIARIDPTLARQAVREAGSSVARAQADLELRAYTLDQAKPLFEQRVITETEFRTAQYNAAVAQASLESARAALDRAQRNLEYTVIHAPIDGIVVERNVDVGQTVAASLSAPQLFLIAEDLARMQILASVDESDIGSIREGQPVRFTVQAYPDDRFSGTVRQVRLQSKTTENVVNYTVVIEVENPEHTLLPGMTATVDIQIAKVTDVLRVPNVALRLRATDGMQAAVRDGAQPGPEAGRGAGGGGRLWYLDDEGRLMVAQVRTGLSDGQYTEVEGEEICEGMQVIAGLVQGTTSGTGTNPFQQTSPSGGPPRGGGPPPGM